MRRLRPLLAFVLTLLVAVTVACYWDTDTAADEAVGKTDLVGTLVGRFYRYPPLYYEMRLKRVTEEVKSHPSRLDLYDDAGVAAARLGMHDLAISWMERKRATMVRLDMTPEASKEAWYRYYSNLGTFTSYGLLSDERGKDHLARLDKAIALLKKGLEINPDAHFGREMYQLRLIAWVRDVKLGKENEAFGTTLIRGWNETSARKGIEAFAGLIRLGSAWESPDVYVALCDALLVCRDASLASFAFLRAQELRDGGKKPFVKINDEFLETIGASEPYVMPEPSIMAFNREEYKRLRRLADQYVDARNAFMTTRLRAGRHPDTDPKFWEGYVEPAPLEVGSPPYFQTPHGRRMALNLLAGGILCGLPAILLVIGIVWLRRRSAKRRDR